MKLTLPTSLPIFLLALLLTVTSCKPSAKGDSATSEEKAADNDELKKLDKEAFQAAITKSGVVVVDLRMPQEFEQTHIEGAINVNFFDPEFKYKLLELDRDKKYYLYDKGEATSIRAMNFMEENDFKHVYILKEGYRNWNTVHADDQKSTQ